MAMMRFPDLRKRSKELLSPEEYASLKEVGNGPLQRPIPDDHRQRLIAMGYIRETKIQEVGNCFALTGVGLRRLVTGNWWLANDR